MKDLSNLNMNEHWRSLFNTITDFIILKDGEGRWLDANLKAQKVFQLENIDFKGKSNEELALWNKHLNPVIKKCAINDEVAWKEKRVIRLKIVIPDSDEKPRVYEVQKTPVFHEDGSRKLLMLVGRDITRDQYSKDKVSIADKVIESSTEGIMVTNADRRIIYVNPAFMETTGFHFDEVKGKNPRILQSGLQDREFYRKMWESIGKSGKWQGEIWNKRKDGDIYLEWLTIHAIYDDEGTITHYVANFRDITEREKIKKDVELTGQLQQKVLPQDLEHEWVSIQTIYKPARHVSGDHYNYTLDIKKQKMFGYLYDVMGHGLATALQSSYLRVLFEQISTVQLSLSEKMYWVNNEILKFFTDDMFAGAICFEFDFKQNLLTYCSSGINKFIVLTGQSTHMMEEKGIFLGLMPDQHYQTNQISFQSGDSFHFLSDGLMDVIPADIQFSSYLESVNFLKQLAYEQNNKDDVSALCIRIN